MLREIKIGSETTSPLGNLICGAFVGLKIHVSQGVELINKSAVAAGSEKTVPIAQTRRSFVEAGKLTSKIVYLLALKCVGISIQIKRPTSEIGHRLRRIARSAIRVGKQWSRIILHDVTDNPLSSS